jgi:hypothetical protein
VVSISYFLIGEEEPKFTKVDNTVETSLCWGGGGGGGGQMSRYRSDDVKVYGCNTNLILSVVSSRAVKAVWALKVLLM